MGWKDLSYWLKSILILSVIAICYLIYFLIFVPIIESTDNLLFALPYLFISYILYYPLYLLALITGTDPRFNIFYYFPEFAPTIKLFGYLTSIIIWFLVFWFILYIIGKLKRNKYVIET